MFRSGKIRTESPFPIMYNFIFSNLVALWKIFEVMNWGNCSQLHLWNKDCVMNRSHAFQVGYFSLYLLSLFDRREWPFIDFNVFEVLNKTVRKYVRIQKCKSKRRQTLAMYRPYYTNLIHKRQAWNYGLGLISDLNWLPPYMMSVFP